MPTLDEIKQAIGSEFEEGTSSWDVALILLSAACVGNDEAAVVGFTGLPTEFVHEVGERLRASEIWQPDGTTAAAWFEEDGGAIAFAIDVLVGLGMVERVPSEAA